MKARELIKILKDNGYFLIRANGHLIYGNGFKTIPVPHHKDISTGTLRDIFTILTGSREAANLKMRYLRGK